MSTVHVGSNKKYAEGWEAAFGGRAKKSKASNPGAAKKKSQKKKTGRKKP